MKDIPWAHCISSVSPSIGNWSLIWGKLSIEVSIVNGEAPFIGGWLTTSQIGVLKGEIVGLMTLVSSISSVTGAVLSAPCLSPY